MEIADVTYLADAFRRQAPESALMWCRDDTKTPLVPHCQERVDSGEIQAWNWERFEADTQQRLARNGYPPNTIAILAHDIVVLDFDNAEIFERVATLFPEDFDEDNVVNERTRKGRHFFYKRPAIFDTEGIYDKAGAFAKAGFEALDIKTRCSTGTRGVIVIAPSPNKEWVTSPMECDLQEPSPALIEWILTHYERLGSAKPTASPRPLSRATSDGPASALPAGLPEILAALLPSRADNYADWIRVGMILFNEGVPLTVWRDWSKQSAKFQEGACEAAWESFKKGSLTIASLWAMLKIDNLGVFRTLHGKRREIETALLSGAKGSHEDLATLFYNNNPDEYLYEDTTKWWFCHDTVWANCQTEAGPATLMKKITKCIRVEIADLRAYYADQQRALSDADDGAEKIKAIEAKSAELSKLSTKIGTAGFVAGITTFLRGLYCTRTNEIIEDIKQRDSTIVDVRTLMNYRRELFAFSDMVYDMEAKRVRPIQRSDYIATTCGYRYPQQSDPEVRAQIMAFLHSIWDSKEEPRTDGGLVNYWLDTVASCLNGNRTQQAFYIHTGSGGNGKGVLQTLIRSVFGAYFAPLSAAILTQPKAANGHTADIAELVGKRFVAVNEPEGDVKLNEGIIKEFTGGDPISASRKGKDPFVFTPQFGLFMYCNHMPSMKTLSGGGVRRIRVVDYPFKFVERPVADFEKQADPLISKCIQSVEWRNELIMMLIDHYPRIHGKAIDGIETPAAVVEACKSYIEDNNRVWSWWNETYQVQAGGFVIATDALHDFNAAYPTARLDAKGFKDALSFNGIVIAQSRTGIDRGKRGVKDWAPRPQTSESQQ